MSMSTPLARVRGLGSAKDGTHHWWLQRVTAVALVPLVLIFTYYVIVLTGAEHAEVIATLGNPINATIAILAVFTAFLHLKLGVQVVVEDYVHGAGKILLLLFNTFACTALGLLCVLAILKIAFGG